MQIIRVEAKVKKSMIDGVSVDELPKGLQIKMVGLLDKLAGVKHINIRGEAKSAVLELSDRNVTLTYLDRKTRKEFLDTIELLLWYKGPHWYSMRSEAIGAPVYCAHCSYRTVPGAVREHCPVLSCPSHERWSLIIGPDYKPPEEDPRSPELPQVVKRLLGTVKD